MVVLSASETAWSQSYDLFFAYVPNLSSVFWRVSGSSCEDFWTIWAYVELKNRLGSALGALFVLEIVFTSRTPTILEGFGDLLERFLEIFLYFFWM